MSVRPCEQVLYRAANYLSDATVGAWQCTNNWQQSKGLCFHVPLRRPVDPNGVRTDPDGFLGIPRSHLWADAGVPPTPRAETVAGGSFMVAR